MELRFFPHLFTSSTTTISIYYFFCFCFCHREWHILSHGCMVYVCVWVDILLIIMLHSIYEKKCVCRSVDISVTPVVFLAAGIDMSRPIGWILGTGLIYNGDGLIYCRVQGLKYRLLMIKAGIYLCFSILDFLIFWRSNWSGKCHIHKAIGSD